jgi:hypothetical protein
LNRSKRSYRIFLLLFSIAALWISIGSLVHFHQYKIYGHRLLSEVVISKRENELPGSPDHDGFVSIDGLIPGSKPALCTIPLEATGIVYSHAITLSDLFTGNSLSLRAPPAC